MFSAIWWLPPNQWVTCVYFEMFLCKTKIYSKIFFCTYFKISFEKIEENIKVIQMNCDIFVWLWRSIKRWPRHDEKKMKSIAKAKPQWNNISIVLSIHYRTTWKHFRPCSLHIQNVKPSKRFMLLEMRRNKSDQVKCDQVRSRKYVRLQSHRTYVALLSATYPE